MIDEEIVYRVQCDKCGEQSSGGETETEAKSWAKQEGFVKFGDDDLCPNCFYKT